MIRKQTSHANYSPRILCVVLISIVWATGPSMIGGSAAAGTEGVFFSTVQDPNSSLFLPPFRYAIRHRVTTDAVVIADLNGDLQPDVLFTRSSRPGTRGYSWVIGVMLGNGDGTLQPVVWHPGDGYGARAIAVADIQGDGKQDLIVINQCGKTSDCSGPSTVVVMFGAGDGSFHHPLTYDTGTGGANSIAVADVDGDGKTDLIVGNSVGSTVGVLLSHGGRFDPAVSYDSGAGTAAVGVGDVNGDGKPDIVAANQDSNSVAVLLGNGDGTFQPRVEYASGGIAPNAIAITDLNGDRKADLVVANSSGEANGNGSVAVLLGNGGGTFASPVAYDSGATGAGSIALQDVDGDGKTDVLLGNGFMLIGNGDGSLEPAVSLGTNGTLATGDLNADGRPDGVTAPSSVYVLVNNSGLRNPTTVTLSSSPNPSFRRELVTYSALVTRQSGGTVTGTMVFRDGSRVIGTSAVFDNAAHFSKTYMEKRQVGNHEITAVFLGNPQDSGTVSEILIQTIIHRQILTFTRLTSSLNPSQAGQPVTFSAELTPPPPDGNVLTFYDDGTVMAQVPMTGGAAAFTISTLRVKRTYHLIQVRWPGNGYVRRAYGALRQIVH